MWRRVREDQRGQSIVEFALVLPVLLLIVLAIIEFGRGYSAKLIMQNATREGSRLAITGASDSAVTTRVMASMPTLDTTRVTVAVSPAAPRRAGDLVTVTTNYRFRFVTKFFRSDQLLTLSTKVTMRME